MTRRADARDAACEIEPWATFAEERGRPGRLYPGSALPQGRGLADALAQEVQLGAPGAAVADDLDLLDPRAVDHERPLDADAARDLANGDRPGDAAAARRITVPSKTWMRSLPPSTTRADTLTVSPEASSGRSVRIWSATISSSTFTVGPFLLVWRRAAARRR